MAPIAATPHPVLITVVIVVAVLGLAVLRARSWVRKERVLRRVGQDLHTPDEHSSQKPS